MSSARTRIFASAIRDMFKRHAKVIICCVALMVVGIILGGALAYREVDGNFEVVARVDAETSSGKIFLFGSLILLAFYALILLSGLNNKTVFIICVPFFATGFILGRFALALIMRYDVFGIFNLIFVYLPLILVSFALMLIAACTAIGAPRCECADRGGLRPSFVKIVKLYLINLAVAFVICIIIGALVGGVIVVSIF